MLLSAKTYLKVSGVIFFVVGILHLVRFLTGLSISFGTSDVPQWISPIGFVVAEYLAYSSFALSQKKISKK